jgi:3-oxoacyl-[acyl-carrier protein] reductase
MDLGLKNKRALVTGASKGIGRETARVLAREGCDVHLVARSESALKSVAAEIAAASGRRITYSALDLSISEALARLGPEMKNIDILVNNAGAIPAGTLAAVDEAQWRAAWDLKVFG